MSAFLSSVFSSKSNRAPRRVVGVDIGSTSIKVVELENRDDVVNVTTYGEILLGPYGDAALGDAVSLDAKKEQLALVDIFRESAVQAQSAVFSVPMSSSFVTVIRVPKLEDEDALSGQVAVEARKYIPIPINEVSLDWAKIERAENSTDSDEQEVLLVAIQNEVLQRLQSLMKRTNLPEQPTEIECFSTIRGASGSTNSKPTAVLDIGGSSTKLYIIRNGLLEQLHRVRSGGAHITKQIATDLSTDFADAEVRKRGQGNDSDEVGYTISRVHEKVLTRTLRELQQVIHNYEQEHDSEVANVILTGGVTQHAKVLRIVEDVLSKKTYLADPFAKTAYPAFMEDVVKEVGPTFTVALGAALRQFE